MADVPAWMLLVQTVLSGGIGAAATLIVPRAERWKRQAEQRAAAHAVMRSKAEEIFSELKVARAMTNAAMDRCFALMEVGANDSGVLDVTPFRALDMATGLIATYYPEGLKIIDAASVAMKVRCDPFKEIMGAHAAGTHENKVARVKIVQEASGVTSDAIRELTSFMAEAVAVYHPSKLP